MLCRVCCVCKKPIDKKGKVYAETIMVKETVQGDKLELAECDNGLSLFTELEVCSNCYETQRSLQQQFFGQELLPALSKRKRGPRKKSEVGAESKKRRGRPKKVDKPLVKVKDSQKESDNKVERKPPPRPTIPE